MYQPIRNRIAGLQLRALNQGRMPFGIQPGFEGPVPDTCQYIAGAPNADDTCKCGRPALPRSAYCAEHHARCWTTEEETADSEDADVTAMRSEHEITT